LSTQNLGVKAIPYTDGRHVKGSINPLIGALGFDSTSFWHVTTISKKSKNTGQSKILFKKRLQLNQQFREEVQRWSPG
jgi:hypothetical protein